MDESQSFFFLICALQFVQLDIWYIFLTCWRCKKDNKQVARFTSMETRLHYFSILCLQMVGLLRIALAIRVYQRNYRKMSNFCPRLRKENSLVVTSFPFLSKRCSLKQTSYSSMRQRVKFRLKSKDSNISLLVFPYSH